MAIRFRELWRRDEVRRGEERKEEERVTRRGEKRRGTFIGLKVLHRGEVELGH